MFALLSSIALVAAAAVPTPPPSQTGSLALSRLPDEAALARLLWEHAPELVEARARLGEAGAEAVRARLFPNPTLTATWGTIPVAPTNPPNLPHPYAHIPNYTLALSETFELGKRGPRQTAAARTLDAAQLAAADKLRRQVLDLYDAIGRVAAAAVRADSLARLAEDAARLTQLQRERARHGDTAGLDADRSRLEEESLRAGLSDEEQKVAEALIDCGRLSGLRCEPFDGAAAAQAFLAEQSAAQHALGASAVERRPDLRSLEAQAQAAGAAAALARAKRIPDPTVQAGFTYDTFVVSGNQPRSFALGVAIPLPFFDHGQVELAQARSAEAAARASHARLLAQAQQEIEALAARARALQQRRTELQESSLPLARSVVDRLTAAVRSGGVPLQDLLLARRSLGELLQTAADLDLQILENTLAVRRAAEPGPELPPDAPATAFGGQS